MNISKDWLPAPKSINALPKPLREYIHGLETLCDPQYLIQELTMIRDAVSQLESALAKRDDYATMPSENEYNEMITRAVHKFQDEGRAGNVAEIKKEMGVRYGYAYIFQCAEQMGYRILKGSPVITNHARSGYTVEDPMYYGTTT